MASSSYLILLKLSTWFGCLSRPSEFRSISDNLILILFLSSVFGRTPRDIREWTQPPEFQYAIYYSNVVSRCVITDKKRQFDVVNSAVHGCCWISFRTSGTSCRRRSSHRFLDEFLGVQVSTHVRLCL